MQTISIQINIFADELHISAGRVYSDVNILFALSDFLYLAKFWGKLQILNMHWSRR